MFRVLQIVLDRDGIAGASGFPGQRFVLGYDRVKAAPDTGLAARIMPVGAQRARGAGVSWMLVRGPAVLPSGRVGRSGWSHRDPSCQYLEHKARATGDAPGSPGKPRVVLGRKPR